MPYAMTRAETGQPLGAVGLSIAAAHSRAERGYWVGGAYWNLGYCTEAGAAVIALAFGSLHLHRVQARHFLRDPASGRVMQKLGMRQEGVHRGACRRWARFEDVAQYALLAEDWERSDRRSPAASCMRTRWPST